MTLTPATLAPAVLVSLIVWRVYRRIRRNIGRQPVQPRRMITRMVIFGAICILAGAVSWQNLRLLAGLGGGLLLGVPLALVGLRFTRFETTAAGSFYTPNAYIGIGLSLLLTARVVYRLTVVYGPQHNPDGSPPTFMQSPLTLFVFGLLASYYIAYYAGVFLRCRQPKATAADRRP